MIDERIRAAEDYLLTAVASDSVLVTTLAQHVLRSGGKRLRVALTFLGAGFGEGAHDEDLVKLASAIELTHVATLYHDDVIDRVDRRHGVASVGANWTNTLAVRSGDYLLARASVLAAEVGGEVPRVLAGTIAALVDGQTRETESLFRADRTEEHYLRVIEGKTARLYSAACYLGARVGEAGREVAEALRRYGLAFGMAFQILDDLLDFLSDEATIGKPVGTDLKEGVYTLPLIDGLRRRPGIAGLLHDRDAVIAALEEAGSFDYARGMASRYSDDARAIAEALPARPERRELVDFPERYILAQMPVSRGS